MRKQPADVPAGWSPPASCGKQRLIGSGSIPQLTQRPRRRAELTLVSDPPPLGRVGIAAFILAKAPQKLHILEKSTHVFARGDSSFSVPASVIQGILQSHHFSVSVLACGGCPPVPSFVLSLIRTNTSQALAEDAG